MNFRRLADTNTLIVTQPAKAWRMIARRDSAKRMLGEYLYPMIALCCLSTFIGVVSGNGFGLESLYPAIIRTALQFVGLFVSYHIIAIINRRLSAIYAPNSDKKAEPLACYSMAVVLLLTICLGLFPNFRIIAWIAQFYTVKIVWDGAAVLMRIPEEKRLGYTMILSILIIIVPIIMSGAMSALSDNL